MGTLLQAEVGSDRMPLAAMACLDPGKAAAKSLKAYLLALIFQVRGSPPKRFRLEVVHEEWPESFENLDYPSASIVAPDTPTGEHALAPTMLEETFELYGKGTVLWKTGELELSFQVDFWCSNEPDREAIAAGLEEAFNPTERRSGIMVQGSPDYFDRSVRLTFTRRHRADDGQSSYQGEHRLSTTIVADVDVVQLRQAVALAPVLSADGERVPVGALEPSEET